MFSPSFFHFFRSSRPAGYNQPLPIASGDPFWVQALAADGDPLPAGLYPVDIVEPYPVALGAAAVYATAAFQARIDDAGRIHLNEGGAPIPTVGQLRGDFAFRITLPGNEPVLSNPVSFLLDPPYSRMLRYRGATSSSVFDYTEVTAYQQLRLPLRLDRPTYRVEERSASPGGATLYRRIQKQVVLETDYLAPPYIDALQLALRHEVFQLQDPETGQWASYTPVGEMDVLWGDSVYQTEAQVRGMLLAVDSSAVAGSFSPPGAFSADYTNDYTL